MNGQTSLTFAILLSITLTVSDFENQSPTLASTSKSNTKGYGFIQIAVTGHNSVMALF